ncbi:MAG: hypothetical protein ACJARO_001512, partial [Bacteriovoracaceae bacterium]
MKKPLKYLFILLTLILISCQTWIATKNLATNIITAPISWMKSGYNAITGNTYDSYVKETDEKKEGSSDLKLSSDCLYKVGGKMITEDAFNGLSEDLKKVAEKVCSCKSWGDCPPSETCSCDTLCPDDLTIFDHPDNKSFDASEDNCLAFRNDPYADAYSDNPMTAGYCWGHASMTSKFNRLGFFRPNQEVPCVKEKTCEEGDERWLGYFEKVIYDIKHNIPREIPSFSNLREFSSSYPSLELALGNAVANEWGEKSMTRQGVGQILRGGKSMSSKKIDKLFERVSTNERFKLNTQLLFSPKDNGLAAHVVLATKAYVENGVRIICIRDSNAHASMSFHMPDGKCAPQNQMRIGADDVVTYPPAVAMSKEYEEVSKEEYDKLRAEGKKGRRTSEGYMIETNP